VCPSQPISYFFSGNNEKAELKRSRGALDVSHTPNYMH
jgi:hypothetical protein